MHLKQSASLIKSGFTYSACGLFTKNKERIQKLKETRDSRYIYRNELDQSCLQHSIAQRDLKIQQEEQLHQVLRDKAFIIAKNPKYEYERGLASIVFRFFDKNSASLPDKFAKGTDFVLLLNKVNNQLKNCKNQLLENLKKKKYIDHFADCN